MYSGKERNQMLLIVASLCFFAVLFFFLQRQRLNKLLIKGVFLTELSLAWMLWILSITGFLAILFTNSDLKNSTDKHLLLIFLVPLGLFLLIHLFLMIWFYSKKVKPHYSNWLLILLNCLVLASGIVKIYV